MLVALVTRGTSMHLCHSCILVIHHDTKHALPRQWPICSLIKLTTNTLYEPKESQLEQQLGHRAPVKSYMQSLLILAGRRRDDIMKKADGTFFQVKQLQRRGQKN